MAAEKKSETEADAVMLMPPDRFPQHDAHWLNGADIYESLTERVVLNPRNLNPQTLEDIDFEWLKSRALWHRWHKYERDATERQKAGLT